jgi:hypothetical protein
MGLPISPALKEPKIQNENFYVSTYFTCIIRSTQNTNENLFKLLYITNGRGGCWEVEN